MEPISGNSGRTRLKRIFVCACIVINFACLVVQAVQVRLIHHSLAATMFVMAWPVTGVLCGLYCLHAARERA